MPSRFQLRYFFLIILAALLRFASSSLNPYETLGVQRAASDSEVKKKYRALALLWHPDKHSGEEKNVATENFHRIAEAYAILSDPVQRRRYDLTTEQTQRRQKNKFGGGQTVFYRQGGRTFMFTEGGEEDLFFRNNGWSPPPSQQVRQGGIMWSVFQNSFIFIFIWAVLRAVLPAEGGNKAGKSDYTGTRPDEKANASAATATAPKSSGALEHAPHVSRFTLPCLRRRARRCVVFFVRSSKVVDPLEFQIYESVALTFRHDRLDFTYCSLDDEWKKWLLEEFSEIPLAVVFASSGTKTGCFTWEHPINPKTTEVVDLLGRWLERILEGAEALNATESDIPTRNPQVVF